MKPFRRTTGRVAVLDRADVDTDQILPKQFLKRIERTGWAEYLFYDWAREPGFELNRPACAGATILLTGKNFGCGSSREHAVWAIQDAGFEVVVAPSFADIFASNALRVGLVTIALPAGDVRRLMDAVDPEHGAEMAVDLEARTLTGPDGRELAFAFDDFARRCLLEGLDPVGLTLAHEPEIAAYEREHESRFDTRALLT